MFGIEIFKVQNKRAGTLLNELCNIFSLGGNCREKMIKVYIGEASCLNVGKTSCHQESAHSGGKLQRNRSIREQVERVRISHSFKYYSKST